MTEMRRRFTDAEKLDILAEIDKLKKDGKPQTSVTNREHISSSMLSYWREQDRLGRLKPTNGVKATEPVEADAMAEQGASPKEHVLELRVANLTSALEIATRRADRAETLLALHKQVAELEAEVVRDTASSTRP